MGDAFKIAHEWQPSRLGHGEWQCIHCYATNREIAVIGDPNHCPDRAKKEMPLATKLKDHVND